MCDMSRILINMRTIVICMVVSVAAEILIEYMDWFMAKTDMAYALDICNTVFSVLILAMLINVTVKAVRSGCDTSRSTALTVGINIVLYVAYTQILQTVDYTVQAFV